MVLTRSTVSEASVVPVDGTTTQDRCMVEHDRTMMGCHTHCPKTMDTRLLASEVAKMCAEARKEGRSNTTQRENARPRVRWHT